MRKEDNLKIPVFMVGILTSFFIAITGAFISIGQAKSDLENLKKNSDLVIRHEALIPVIQSDIAYLKISQQTIQEDIKKILIAVKS